MYLRTVWELLEEGVTPLRARLVERLGVSAPAVSETVGRLEEEGLLRLTDRRHIELTEAGRHLAASVMRKHRLVERLLTDVIGLEWEEVHNEACRWEHVISDRVEERLVALLGAPSTSPFGNPIPAGDTAQQWAGVEPAGTLADDGADGVLARISEHLQVDVERMRLLAEAGLHPGAQVSARRDGDDVILDVEGQSLTVSSDTAAHLFFERV